MENITPKRGPRRMLQEKDACFISGVVKYPGDGPCFAVNGIYSGDGFFPQFLGENYLQKTFAKSQTQISRPIT